MAATDQAVLSAIEHDLLRVEVLALRDEQSPLEAEFARLAAAIAAGGNRPARGAY